MWDEDTQRRRRFRMKAAEHQRGWVGTGRGGEAGLSLSADRGWDQQRVVSQPVAISLLLVFFLLYFFPEQVSNHIPAVTLKKDWTVGVSV